MNVMMNGGGGGGFKPKLALDEQQIANAYQLNRSPSQPNKMMWS